MQIPYDSNSSSIIKYINCSNIANYLFGQTIVTFFNHSFCHSSTLSWFHRNHSFLVVSLSLNLSCFLLDTFLLYNCFFLIENISSVWMMQKPNNDMPGFVTIIFLVFSNPMCTIKIYLLLVIQSLILY